MDPITNTANRIDSSLANARYYELLGQTATDSEYAEFLALRALHDTGQRTFSGWDSGTDLIRASDFENYAREVHEEISDGSDQDWPYTCIDWKRAAEALQQDYTAIDFDGVTYWGR